MEEEKKEEIETPVEQSAQEQAPTPAVAPAQEKKSHVGLIIALVVGIPLFLLIIFMIAMLVIGTLFIKKVGEKIESEEHQITIIDNTSEEEEKEKEETKKEEEKEETPKEDESKEQEIYKSKYDGKTDAEIYDAIQAEKEYVKLTDISGTSDNIVIKSFLFLTQRYSHYINSTERVTRDTSVDKCTNLHYMNINKNDLNKDVICLADLEFDFTHLKNSDPDEHTNPPMAFLITATGKTKLLEYYPEAKVQTLKEKSFDVTSIVKTGSNYKVTVTSYKKYMTSTSPNEEPYEVVDKETFVFNVTVKDKHIVFGTVE